MTIPHGTDLDTAFDEAAAAYDLLTSLSPGYHRQPVQAAVRPGPVRRILRGRRIDTLTWNALCLGVVIPLDATGPGGPRLYRHLRRSVLRFDTVDALAARIERTGFADVRAHPAAGWQAGLVHTLTATSPAEQR